MKPLFKLILQNQITIINHKIDKDISNSIKNHPNLTLHDYTSPQPISHPGVCSFGPPS